MGHNLSSARKSPSGAADVVAAAAVAGAAGEAAGAAAAAAGAAAPAAGPGAAAVAGVRPKNISQRGSTRVTGPGLARPGLPVLFAPPRMLAIRLYCRPPAPQRRSGGHRRPLMRGRPVMI